MGIYLCCTKRLLDYLWIGILVLLVEGGLSLAATKAVSESEYLPLVQSLTEMVKRNWHNIGLWQGEFRLSENLYYYDKECDKLPIVNIGDKKPRRIVRTIEAYARFVLDMEADRLYSEIVPRAKFRALDLDCDLEVATRYSPAFVVITPNECLTFEPCHVYAYETTQSGRKQPHSRAAFRWPLKGPQDKPLPAVPADPRSYLFQSGRFVWQDLQGIERFLSQGHTLPDGVGKVEVAIEESTELCRYIIRTRIASVNAGEQGETIMVFDGRVGYNLVMMDLRDSKGHLLQKRELEYSPMNGVFVPKRVSLAVFDLHGDKQYEFQVEFQNAVLGGKVAMDLFTYKSLPLKEGDLFVDKVEGKEYVFHAGNLQELPISP